MHSLLFSLESSLLAPLLEFALSPSGHVEPRRGLALGWLGSVVAGSGGGVWHGRPGAGRSLHQLGTHVLAMLQPMRPS